MRADTRLLEIYGGLPCQTTGFSLGHWPGRIIWYNLHMNTKAFKAVTIYAGISIADEVRE